MRVGNGVGGFEPIGKELGDGNAGTLNPNNKLRPRKSCAEAIDKQVNKTDSIFILLMLDNCVSHFFIVETS